MKRVVVGASLAVASLAAVFVVAVILWPQARNTVIVDTGSARIERVRLAMCGREFATHIRPGNVEGQYWGGCSKGPTLVMEDGAARYVCAEGDSYNDPRLAPEILRFKISDGECRYAG